MAVLGLRLQNWNLRKWKEISSVLRFSLECLSHCSMDGPASIAGEKMKTTSSVRHLRDDWAKSTVRKILMCKSERNRLSVSLVFGLGCFGVWNEKADTVWGTPCKRGKPQASENPGPATVRVYFFHTLISSSFDSFAYLPHCLCITASALGAH